MLGMKTPMLRLGRAYRYSMLGIDVASLILFLSCGSMSVIFLDVE